MKAQGGERNAEKGTQIASLETENFRVQIVDDVAGVSLCGALKSEQSKYHEVTPIRLNLTFHLLF